MADKKPVEFEKGKVVFHKVSSTLLVMVAEFENRIQCRYQNKRGDFKLDHFEPEELMTITPSVSGPPLDTPLTGGTKV